MKKHLLVLTFLFFFLKVNAQQNISINTLSVNTQPTRFEVARIYIDVANWNVTGNLEVDLKEKFFSAGLKKTYTVSYGYGVAPVANLKDMSGIGNNGFRLSMGSEVIISGTIKYVPIYIDLKSYARVDVVLRTNWNLTTNVGNTTQGYLYYNQSPTGFDINDFTPDATVNISISAAKTILNGDVGIGITNPQNKLDVNGTIHSKAVVVDLNGWSDYVFKPTYQLLPLSEIKNYIDQNQHLPDVPSEQEMVKNGLNVGEMNKLLMKKVEELTLYLIEQNKQIKEANNKIDQLTKKIEAIQK